jgi:hypothetical protein
MLDRRSSTVSPSSPSPNSTSILGTGSYWSTTATWRVSG